MLKSSRYLHYISINKKVAVFNALSGGIAIILPEIAQAFKSGNSYDIQNIVKQFPVLLEIGAVVSDDIDEKEFIRVRLGHSRFGNRMLNVTIVPTLSCNMQCSYCDQSLDIRQYTMSDEICTAVTDYIELKMQKNELLAVTWYGGEPLLAYNKLIKMQKDLLKVCDKHEVDMLCNITTNGLLATTNKIKEMKNAGIHQVQITLDGPQKVHDERRKMCSGKGTYSKTLDKILLIKDLVDVQIRVNIDRNNVDKIEELLNDLQKMDLLENTYLAPVVSYTPICISSNTENEILSGPKFAQLILRYKDYLSKDYLFNKLSPCAMPCTALSANTFVFSPRGYIYRCWHDLDFPDMAIDHVISGGGNPSHNLYWLTYDPTDNPECSECNVLPLCMAGCPAQRRSGVMAPQCCSPLKEHLSEFLNLYLNKTLISQDIL